MAKTSKTAPAAPKSPYSQKKLELAVERLTSILKELPSYKDLRPIDKDIIARYEAKNIAAQSGGDATLEADMYTLFKHRMDPVPPKTIPPASLQEQMRAEDAANALAKYQASHRSIGAMPRILSTVTNAAGDVTQAAGDTLGAVAHVPFAAMQAAAGAMGQTAGEKELGFSNLGQAMAPVAAALGVAPHAAIGGATTSLANLFKNIGGQTMSSAAEKVAQANNLRLQNELMAASATPSQRRLGERFVSGNTQMYKNNAKLGG